MCHHISYRQSNKLFGEEKSRESAKKEITDIISKDCWKPIEYSTKKPDATSFMFMKDKRDKVNGDLIKLKCRHVFSLSIQLVASNLCCLTVYMICDGTQLFDGVYSHFLCSSLIVANSPLEVVTVWTIKSIIDSVFIMHR